MTVKFLKQAIGTMSTQKTLHRGQSHHYIRTTHADASGREILHSPH